MVLIPDGYKGDPQPQYTKSQPPLQLGRIDAIVGIWLKATCMLHSRPAGMASSSSKAKPKPKSKAAQCSAWFACNRNYKPALRACELWLVRGHQLYAGRNCDNKHSDEAIAARNFLEPKWAADRAAREAEHAAVAIAG